MTKARTLESRGNLLGQSAVEKASYISRSVLVSEYDGQT